MKFFLQEKKRVLTVIGLCIYTGALLFLLISLVSYNATDSSWFYVSSDPKDILNQGGFVGAQLAAVLYYMFGGASFLLFIPLICLALIMLTGRTIKTDGERFVASCFLVCIGAIMLTMYGIDCAWSPYPGGRLGFLGAQKLLYYFDPIGRILFLYMSLCASLIILFRWSFMYMIMYTTRAVTTIYALMKKHHVVSKMAKVVGVCLYAFCVRLPRGIVCFLYSLIDGKAFQDTGLLHPEDDHDAR